jgi:hypothetical protein
MTDLIRLRSDLSEHFKGSSLAIMTSLRSASPSLPGTILW